MVLEHEALKELLTVTMESCNSFGIFCNIAGYDLSNLWAFSDLGNIIIVYCNIPMLYIGFRYVMKATKNYRESENPVFNSSVIGMETEYWDTENKN